MPTVNIEAFKQGALGSDLALLQTTDGVKVLDLWLEVISPGLDAYNAEQNKLADFIAFKTEQRIEQVIQTHGSSWQKNTEVTKGVGTADVRRWIVRTATAEYKKYIGYTRKFLKDNSSAHVVAQFNALLKALTEQKYADILNAFYYMGDRPVLDLATHETLALPGLVDGSGNMPIPSNGTNTFSSSHSHFSYLDSTTSGWTNTTTRQSNFKALGRLVSEHGYRQNLVLMCNAASSDGITACPGFRQVVDVSPFVQSNMAALAPGSGDKQVQITSFGNLGGLFRVIGTIENMTVIEADFLPVSYYSVFSYQGSNSPDNPVQWMEKPVVSFSDSPFPFYETLMETEFGASVRKRLNGAHLYVASGADEYVNPTLVNENAVVGDWDGA